MYKGILSEVIKTCRQRIADGDCPSVPAVSVEVLEHAVDQLADEIYTGALQEIALERRRQIVEKGWTLEHDDQHTEGEIAEAGAWYALTPEHRQWLEGNDISFWPWDIGTGQPTTFKPGDRRRDLIKAAALIIAEIERLDRAGAPR